MIQETLQSILTNLENFIDSKTVLGEPVKVGNATLVPLISLKVGLGSGHSEGLGTGGGGGGINVEPRALVVIQETGVSVYTLNGKDTLADLAEAVPGVSSLWETGSSPAP